jgi:hypothetical protein
MTQVSQLRHIRHSFHNPLSDGGNCGSSRNNGFRHHSTEFSSGAMRNMCDRISGNRDNHERFGCEPKRPEGNEGNQLDQVQGMLKKLLDLLKSMLKNTDNCETKKHCEQPETTTPKPVCEPINSVMPVDLNAGDPSGDAGCGPGGCGASSSSGDGSCGASSE